MNLQNGSGNNIRGNTSVKVFKIVLVIMILLLSSSSFAQWEKQSPVPAYLDVRGVGAPTTQKIFIATDDNSFDDGGALFESNDGGTTWTQLNIPTNLNDPLYGIFFLDDQNGWTYGNGIYRTTDGGNNWIELPLLGSTYYLEFYTPLLGIATGNGGSYISYDSGDSWDLSPNGIFHLTFSNNNGIGVSDSGLYHTTDGAVTFNQVYTGEATDAVYMSETVAVSIVDSNIIRSTDGGLTWNVIQQSNGKSKLFKISGSVLLAYGRTGSFPNYDHSVLRSTDAGITWSNIGEVIPEGIFAFTRIDDQTLTAADMMGNMHRSVDAGLTFTQTFDSPGLQPGFLSSASPVFPDNQTGYFGYGSGFVIKTTDGGASWFQISSGSGKTLIEIDRSSNGELLAVGEEGTILKSDGSTPWIIQDSPTSLPLTSVQFINNNDVIACDENGQIYTSTDAGVSWLASGVPPNNLDAKDIDFTSLQEGWIAGSGSIGGAVYQTTDGGNTWTGAQGFGGSYVAVDFENQSGWALNTGGVYYYTTDNGVNWTEGDLPGSPFQVSDIDFVDENTGYVVGYDGYAAKSIDGGVNWEVLPTPNNEDDFTDIYIIGQNEFWLSTNNEAAYYTATGGFNWAVLNINSDGFGSFSGIAASSTGDAWTVGFLGSIEHFNGPPPPPQNRPPEASFEFEANGLTVDFTDTSVDPDGNIVSWLWDFGDSSFSSLQNPTHIFDTSNTYIVRLTVTDDDSATGSTIRFVIVQPNPGGTFGDFTEVTPLDSIFVTPQDEDFWVITTASADFDNDNDLDVAVLGYYVVYNQSVDYKLILIENEGQLSQTEWDFSYIDVPLGSVTTGSSDMAWGDFDGDADLDLVVGSDGETILFENQNGSLVQIETQLPGYWEDNLQAEFDLNSISWADFDNDGDEDLLIPSVFDNSTFTYKTVLMRNDSSDGSGGWVFTEMDSVFASTFHAQSQWADFDNDQDLDLLLTHIAPLTDEGFIRRYRNDGNGQFTGEDILGDLTIEHGEAQWGDYDGDGDMDILIAGNVNEANGSNSIALRVYRNNGNGYDSLEVIDCVPCEGWWDLNAATWADYDNDGDIDIMLAGTYNSGSQIEGRARVYVNDGNGNFTDSENELPAPNAAGSRGGTFSWFDIDNDGDLDYFIAGQYYVPGGNGLVEAQMHVYRNDSPGQNNAPSTPTGLTVTHQNDNTVLLSWQPANDDHTPAASITYDVRVVRKGTHVPSNPQGGILVRIPEPGNVSAVNQWLITGLEDGEYEWHLRAVDGSYIGSFFATGDFSIGITSVNDDEGIPETYALDQNYPNPFNPSTTIKYSLPEEGLVTLKIYNALGEEVKTLANEIQSAGVYNISFDASGLSSGIYFYRIQANDNSSSKQFVETKKMILIK